MEERSKPIMAPDPDTGTRWELINGVVHEWVPGTTELTRPVNVSCTFRPSTNFYDALAHTLTPERGEPVAVPLAATDDGWAAENRTQPQC